MIYKNLIRRKARTMLTILGISIGVAAIITLGALAKGLGAGYNAMLSGSKADLVLSQPDAFDISYSSVDESVIDQIIIMPEVARVSGMLEGFTRVETEPYFFVFGYPKDSFVLDRFRVIDGFALNSHEAAALRGNPILLGSAAAEVLKKTTGDTLRITGSAYKIVGIYETGDAFEDSGLIMDLKDAQNLLGRPRQVSLYYIQLKDAKNKDRFIERIKRQLQDLSISGLDEYAEQQSFDDMLQAYVWVIGGLAIIIGGVGMMNAQLMSMFERTREIGVLRALGWSRHRILWMMLGESLLVSFLGGILGMALGFLLLRFISNITVIMGVSGSEISIDILLQSIMIVVVIGLVGGVYPAYRASKLEPVEALRYEGGSTGKRIHRLPIGGMAVQSLWQ